MVCCGRHIGGELTTKSTSTLYLESRLEGKKTVDLLLNSLHLAIYPCALATAVSGKMISGGRPLI